jgi:Spy/CpxP family protein refolding chaperone
MKRNYWICLLVFSLALNVGGLATFAYLRYQHRPPPGGPRQMQPFREMWELLNLEPGQKQALGSLFHEHTRRVRELRQELAEKRRSLFGLTRQGAPAWPAIQGKIREVSDLQVRLEEEVLRFCLECQEHLKPEQKVAFINLMERRMFKVQGGKGRMGPKWKKDLEGGAPGLPGPVILK